MLSLSHVQCFAAPWTVTLQTPLSMEFSRQEYWNGLQFPPPGVFPNPGVKPASPVSPASAGGFFTTETHLGSTTLYSAIIGNYADPKGSLQRQISILLDSIRNKRSQFMNTEMGGEKLLLWSLKTAVANFRLKQGFSQLPADCVI